MWGGRVEGRVIYYLGERGLEKNFPVIIVGVTVASRLKPLRNDRRGIKAEPGLCVCV